MTTHLPRLRPAQLRGLTVAGLRDRLTRPDREWMRQREVMIACWSYALPRAEDPIPVPQQRAPSSAPTPKAVRRR